MLCDSALHLPDGAISKLGRSLRSRRRDTSFKDHLVRAQETLNLLVRHRIIRLLLQEQCSNIPGLTPEFTASRSSSGLLPPKSMGAQYRTWDRVSIIYILQVVTITMLYRQAQLHRLASIKIYNGCFHNPCTCCSRGCGPT
jgi:hypothetical protein